MNGLFALLALFVKARPLGVLIKTGNKRSSLQKEQGSQTQKKDLWLKIKEVDRCETLFINFNHRSNYSII
jgi:hypothetical protein